MVFLIIFFFSFSFFSSNLKTWSLVSFRYRWRLPSSSAKCYLKQKEANKIAIIAHRLTFDSFAQRYEKQPCVFASILLSQPMGLIWRLAENSIFFGFLWVKRYRLINFLGFCQCFENRTKKDKQRKKHETECTILSEHKERTDWVVNVGRRKKSKIYEQATNWGKVLLKAPYPSTLATPSRKRSFSKTLFKPEEFKNACRLCVLARCGWKRLEKSALTEIKCDLNCHWMRC